MIASDGLRGKVLVVRQRQRPLAGQSSRSRVFGCWRPTGRRFLIRREHEAGLDLAQPTTATVRRGRYIGIVKYSLGGQASFALAEVWDARSHRRLYDSRACGRDSTIEEPFGTEAVEEVVFLGDGEMAYACDQLRFADRHGDRQIAPRGSNVHNLAVSATWHGELDRLYWATGDRDGEQTHVMELPRRASSLPY